MIAFIINSVILIFQKLKKKEKIFFYILLIINLSAIIISFSRSFWLGIVGKPKIDIEPLEVEPMDKDGAVAFAKNHFIEKIKEIL